MRVGLLWSVQESAHVVVQDTLPQRAVHCAHGAARASVLLLDLPYARRVRLAVSQLLVRSGVHPGAHARWDRVRVPKGHQCTIERVPNAPWD